MTGENTPIDKFSSKLLEELPSTPSDVEIILALSPHDNLEITWGAIVSQEAGTKIHNFEAAEGSHMFLFVNKGKLVTKIGEEVVRVSKGQMLIVRPGERCLGIEPHRVDFICQWLSFRVMPSRRGKRDYIELPRVSNVSDLGMVSELFRLLIEDYHAHRTKSVVGLPPLSSRGSQLLLLSLMARVHEEQPEQTLSYGAPALLAERARDYMRTNFSKISSVAELAELLECSVGYLRTAFRCTYGYGPLTCLRRFRMFHARALIIKTQLPVGDIAKQCGYSNQGHFTRVFTKEHGLPPMQYRIAHSRQYKTPGI